MFGEGEAVDDFKGMVNTEEELLESFVSSVKGILKKPKTEKEVFKITLKTLLSELPFQGKHWTRAGPGLMSSCVCFSMDLGRGGKNPTKSRTSTLGGWRESTLSHLLSRLMLSEQTTTGSWRPCTPSVEKHQKLSFNTRLSHREKG